MAYVGTPIDTTNQFQSLQGKRFNGDGSTTAFTLDIAPSSVFDIEVFVENVRQDPNSAYNISGTTLTFTGAPPSGTNNIYVVHQAKAVGTIDLPEGALVDLNGGSDKLVLDADGDTTISADTDDQIDFKVGGSDVVTLGPSNLTVDISGNIRLDADDAGEVRLLDGGTQYAALKNDSSRLKIQGIVSDKDILFAVNDGGSETTALTIDASEAGLAIFNAGVALGGTGAANTLDDYEEGTWTPNLTGDSWSGSLNYTQQQGVYVKIGRMVFISAFIAWNANNFSSSSGRLDLQGLPFTTSNQNNYRGGVPITYASNAWTGLTIYQQAFRVEPNSTKLGFNFSDATDGHITTEISNHSNIQASGSIMLGGTYAVD